jgi:hypothetical protein
MDSTSEPASPSLPIGQSGRLEAMALNAGADAAVLVRERGTDGRARALLTTDKLPTGERLVVMPLDDEIEVRVDGDALAVWLGSGSLMATPRTTVASPSDVPIWASVAGGALLVLVVGLAVLGSAVAFAWILGLFA